MGIMPTKTELALEQTQQGISDEVLVEAETNVLPSSELMCVCFVNVVLMDDYEIINGNGVRSPSKILSEVTCKFYSAGVCKYGQFCRFSHPLELNVLALPKKLGKTKCSFYMRSGMCDYGASCRFDHPDPIFVLYPEQESSVVKGESVCKHKEGLELTDAGYVLLYSEATQLNLSVPMITVDRFMYMYPNCILDGYQAPECMEMWSSSSPPASNVENFEDYTEDTPKGETCVLNDVGLPIRP
ncbi:zinc finger CCCH domain-containing protein 43, partial [Tanacetum coccineum]